MVKIQIDTDELQLMLNEYWSINNNDTCKNMTYHFLQRQGLSENKIKSMFNDWCHWERDFDTPIVCDELRIEFDNKLQECREYYVEDSK